MFPFWSGDCEEVVGDPLFLSMHLCSRLIFGTHVLLLGRILVPGGRNRGVPCGLWI